MKVMIFGANGQVGTELARQCHAAGIATELMTLADVDLSVPSDAMAAVGRSDADLVINAAAYTAVDEAENARDLARAINGGAPTMMARAAADRGMPFLHVSTDYVYDGTKTSPWTESDKANPLGTYGRTKLAGDVGVAGCGGAFAILRTSWVFSAHGGNFVKTMLRLGAERDSLNIVDDQRGGPTPAADIAAALLTMARAFHAGKGSNGIFHFAGAPTVSWADFAQAIFARAGLSPTVTRIPTSAYPTPAKRPLNSALDCRRIAETFGIAQPDWREGLDAVLNELKVTA